jgi:hypothetical protein
MAPSLSSSLHNDPNVALVVDITRVEDAAGFIGTVRYVGMIHKASYVGVEWDDPTRGKHNGTLVEENEDGSTTSTHYFTTVHATGGSLVKRAKLRTGRALTMDVVHEKYVPMDSTERVAGLNGVLGHMLPSNAKNASSLPKQGKAVELVGELHIRRHQQVEILSSLALRRCSLHSIDPSFHHGNHHDLRHVVELDLADNLFSSWQDSIWSILRQLPQLERLSLAGNRINDIDIDDTTSITAFQPADGAQDVTDTLPPSSPPPSRPYIHTALRHLNLQKTNIRSFHTIRTVQTTCPQLVELILAGNPLRRQEQHDRQEQSGQEQLDFLLPQPSLRCLDLSDCGLQAPPLNAECFWPPHLSLLNLDGNPDFWRQVSLGGGDDNDNVTATVPLLLPPPLPRSLETLQIADQTVLTLPQLYQWLGGGGDQDDDAKKKSVTRLRIDAQYYPRLATIAHLPYLVILNGGFIRSEERRNAGHWLLRSDNNECGGQIESLRQYWQLQLPDAVVMPTGGRSSVDDLHHARLVTLTFHCAVPEANSTASLTRNVPRTVSMAALSKMVARHYGIDEESFRLYELSNNNDGFPEVLESLESVADEAQVMINSVDNNDKKKNDHVDDENKGSNAAKVATTTTTGITTAHGARWTSTMEEKIRAQEEERQRFVLAQQRLRR